MQLLPVLWRHGQAFLVDTEHEGQTPASDVAHQIIVRS
jgi:hypothetical protein